MRHCCKTAQPSYFPADRVINDMISENSAPPFHWASFELLHSAAVRHPLSPYIHALTFLRAKDLFVHRRLGTVCASVLGPLGRRQAGRANRWLEPTPTAEVCMEQQNDETTHPICKNGLVIEPPSSVEDEREHRPPLPFMPSPPAASCFRRRYGIGHVTRKATASSFPPLPRLTSCHLHSGSIQAGCRLYG